MMGRLPRPDLTRRYRCDVCEAGICDVLVENPDKPPTFCPIDRSFGKIVWLDVTDEDKEKEDSHPA